MSKNGFPKPIAKNRYRILNLLPKKHVFKKTKQKKKHGLKKEKITYTFCKLNINYNFTRFG